MTMRHLRLALLTLPAVVLLGCASEPPRPLAAHVTEYGLYERGIQAIRPDSAAPSGQTRDYTGQHLAKATQIVPVKLGTSFGFCYEVNGFTSGARPMIAIDIEHPAFSAPGGTPVSKHQLIRNVMPRDGILRDCTGYGFDHSFELLPGDWRFTVVIDGKPVLSQTFVAL